ncbi:hypothetical protein ACFQXA_10350 [Nocardiopsis composta]
MTAMAPARTEPDLSFLLDHTSHVLRSKMSAALAEIDLTPACTACSSTPWRRSAPRSSSPRSATWTRPRWW